MAEVKKAYYVSRVSEEEGRKIAILEEFPHPDAAIRKREWEGQLKSIRAQAERNHPNNPQERRIAMLGKVSAANVPEPARVLRATVAISHKITAGTILHGLPENAKIEELIGSSLPFRKK